MAKTKNIVIKFSDIKSSERFADINEPLAEKLNEVIAECERTGKYSKRLASFVSIAGQMMLGIEDAVKSKHHNVDMDAAKADLLFFNKLLIKANAVAHYYLNGMESNESNQVEDLNSYIKKNKYLFKKLTVIHG